MVTECDGIDRSITIEFPTTGIEVAPHETDLRLDRRKYSHGKFTLTRGAGEFISSNVPDYSKAYIRISDTRAHRMVFFSDGLTFEKDIDGDNVVELELADASKILQNGTITENFEEVTLEEVVDYIMGQYGDPDDVVPDYDFVDSVDIQEKRDSLEDESNSNIVSEKLDEFGSALARGLLKKSDEFLGTDYKETIHDGFDWEKVTPLQALSDVMEEFELDWWVTKDGVLKIGIDGTTGQALASTGTDDNIVIQHYGVTSAPDRVRGVHLEGSYQATHGPKRLNLFGDLEYNKLVGIAEAVDYSSNGVVVGNNDIQKGFSSLEELEEITQRQLYREMINQTSGSIGVNGLASSDKETLALLDVGDMLFLDSSLQEKCGDRKIITGPYLIFGIQHKRNPREGWTIDLELTRIPDFSQVETASVWYDPDEDKEYDSLEEYQSETTAGFNFEPNFDVPTDIILGQ